MTKVINKNDIMQVYDVSEVKKYFKINSGFIFTSKILVKADKIKDYKAWVIECNDLPDELIINGKEYKLHG